MPAVILPSQYPLASARGHEGLLQEVKSYPIIVRVDITNTIQEHPNLHDLSPVYAYLPGSTAGSFHAEQYQAIGLPCNDEIQPGRTCTSSYASDNGLLMDPLLSPSDNFFFHHRTLPEEYGKYSAIPVETEAQEPISEASPSGRMSTLSIQVSVIHFDPGHGPMTPPIHDGGPSQSRSAAQVHQHTSAASPIALNQVVEVSQRPRISCIMCERNFHARKALNRHIYDVHTGAKKYHYLGYNFTYIGTRRVHGNLPSRQRATRKVVAPRSKSRSMLPPPSESKSTSTFAFFFPSRSTPPQLSGS
jgi:hypothetical protein